MKKRRKKHMKIIIEGCDGTGKTTLANLLAERYGMDICHCTHKDPADYDFYRQTLRKENVIWDRHTLGELIYPQVFNRKQKIGTEDARLIMHYAKEENVKVFVLTCNVTEIWRRLDRRGNEHRKIYENVPYIDERFRFYAKEFGIPIIDTSKMTLKEIYNIISKDFKGE